MNGQRLRSLSVVAAGVAALAWWAGSALTAYAHDPAASKHPDAAHIHQKGKVTDGKGAGIGGAVSFYSLIAPIFPPLAPTCVAFFEMTQTTPADGSYDFILYVKADTQECRDAFDKITFDKTKLRWEKLGYGFKPK